MADAEDEQHSSERLEGADSAADAFGADLDEVSGP